MQTRNKLPTQTLKFFRNLLHNSYTNTRTENELPNRIAEPILMLFEHIFGAFSRELYEKIILPFAIYGEVNQYCRVIQILGRKKRRKPYKTTASRVKYIAERKYSLREI